MTTFAALGDSITLGVGDPAPGGGWRGWAAFLAESLPGGRLVNLAANGARAADVERTQLPRALELRPDVASVVVGVNDILRAGFDAAAHPGRARSRDRLAERGRRGGPHHAAAGPGDDARPARRRWPGPWPGGSR